MAPHRDSFEGARWAPVENQHITLKFLGSTLSDRLSAVSDAITSTASGVAPRAATLTSLGAFPSGRRARVLWVGVDDPDEVMATAARRLDAALEPLGFRVEKRAFHPHLTLARFKVPRLLPAELPEVAAGLEPFAVDELVLFRSRLHPKGARYEAIDAFPLGG